MRLIAVGAAVLGAAGGAAAMTASGVHGANSSAAKVTSNGGARDWVAFGSRGASGGIGAGEMTLPPDVVIYVANTSTANNPLAITYTGDDGKHKVVYTSTLGRGAARFVYPEIPGGAGGGYFQMRAKYPVIVGGHVEVLSQARKFSQETGKYGFTRDVEADSHLVPLDWQQACVPYVGSPCPTGATAPAPSPSQSP